MAEVKASYRRLAMQFHPDVNSGDRFAQAKFIELTEAYKFLISAINSSTGTDEISTSCRKANVVSETAETAVSQQSPPTKKVIRKRPTVQFHPPLSELEQQLKWSSYQNLQKLLKERRFARAIVLVEALAQRIPQDPEVHQWQAIIYQQRGKQLLEERQLDKAKIYLKKALKTDPQNRSLWAEIKQDFHRIQQLL
ncbi:DnaJ domain-containing protein [Lyngbya aestuarii]|uniref:DnaJ domain-containing protein n=1 Tax=Lyngbya aestuarii TaxID=118322 RepID=UPI00403E2B6E